MSEKIHAVADHFSKLIQCAYSGMETAAREMLDTELDHALTLTTGNDAKSFLYDVSQRVALDAGAKAVVDPDPAPEPTAEPTAEPTVDASTDATVDLSDEPVAVGLEAEETVSMVDDEPEAETPAEPAPAPKPKRSRK
jgi:hypothetical protein